MNFIKKLLNKLVCRFKGCTYSSDCFSNFQLSFCTRCGEEVAGRTFDDILPVPEDWDLYEDEYYHS